jgi:hypothetical protein
MSEAKVSTLEDGPMPSTFCLVRNALACAFLALALSACILSAKEPIYSDADAKLVFTAAETTLMAYSLKNGQWVAEDEPMVLKAEGQHYSATVEKSLAQVTFVPVEGNWYVVQSIEDKKTPLYTLVRDDKNELHVFPIACSEVKKIGTASNHVDFVKDDCFLKPGVDHKPLFSALSANPGADTLKLVPKN